MKLKIEWFMKKLFYVLLIGISLMSCDYNEPVIPNEDLHGLENYSGYYPDAGQSVIPIEGTKYSTQGCIL